jgi:hypothetical protein
MGTLLLHEDERLAGIGLLLVGSLASFAWIAALRQKALQTPE